MKVETLTSAPFTARIGMNLTVEAAQGELTVEVIEVRDRPSAAGPNSKRTPFSVLLHGPESPNLADGSYHLRADGDDNWRLEGCYLNRIIPPASTDGTGAYYQVIFS